jgi:hypothetical protein
MTLVAWTIFAGLTAIALLHIAWGFGVLWPRRTEIDLVATVIGYTKSRMPSPARCFAAAFVIFSPGVIALLLANVAAAPLPRWMIVAAGLGAALVFAIRGSAAYLPAWRALFPREPFASFDRQYYSPLCMLLAAGMFSLVLTHAA